MFLKKIKLNIGKVRSNAGLTMVETLVAISILTIAVIGPLGIIAQALHSSYYTRDQMTAYYLAQEAIEYVRNLRDVQSIGITGFYVDNAKYADRRIWLGDNTADGVFGTKMILTAPNAATTKTNTVSLTIGVGGYQFDAYNDNFLKIGDGIFGKTTGSVVTDSIFKREIYFERVPMPTGTQPAVPQEIVMVVNMYWKTGSSQSKLTLKEYFTNWASKNGL
ncbi:MAG: hypothetical protein WCQ00_00330 [bacterium]